MSDRANVGGLMYFAFHLTFGAYGFWLPNDPRGSWSEVVWSPELRRFGPATKVHDRDSHAHDAHDVALRRAAKQALKYPPVRFNDVQRHAIADGFARACAQGHYTCLACCIAHDHVHLLLKRHERPETIIAGHLKSAATRELSLRNLHPLADRIGKRGTPPTPWDEGCWRCFIDSDDQLRATIIYIHEHPREEGLTEQRWNFLEELPA